jgi:hypothetical protein
MAGFEALRERWEAWRPTKTHAFWFAVVCVIATLIVGFRGFGWVTGGTAATMVSEAGTNARHELATAVCVEEFMKAGNPGERIAKLRDASWFERSDLVAKGGWATMPDSEEPNRIVAGMCASQLAEMKLPSEEVTPASVTIN